MTYFSKIGVALALSLSATAPALADLVRIPDAQGPAILVDSPVLGSILFDCHLSGAEFSNDLFVSRMIGATAAGTNINWTVGQFHGTATLPALAPGQGHVIQNAFPGALGHGTPCRAVLD